MPKPDEQQGRTEGWRRELHNMYMIKTDMWKQDEAEEILEDAMIAHSVSFGKINVPDYCIEEALDALGESGIEYDLESPC